MTVPNISTTRVWVTGAQLPGFPDPQQLLIEQGRVLALGSMAEAMICQTPDLTVIDLEGDWLTLGGVDLQINGALGLPFPDLTAADLPKLVKIGQLLWQQGVDGYLPTIVTSDGAQVQTALATIAKFLEESHSKPEPAAKILGVHLEGPFLNPSKRGAHAAAFLQPLTLERVKALLGDYSSMVKVVTLAPELDPSGEAMDYLLQLGITVSLGHSQATAAQAQIAFDRGATMVTHAFNAMPPLHHREPGLLGAALLDERVWCGLIADGEHVCPMMLQLLLRSQCCQTLYDLPTGLFLVSDALAPLGLADGLYPWDSRQIEIQQGTARLADGTLAGTTLSLLTGVQNLVKWQLCRPELAIYLATDAPRRAINQPGLGIGSPARQLLRWHWSASDKLEWQRLF
jgi:N-acetylglucosamine-6-phosphate deacetylase